MSNTLHVPREITDLIVHYAKTVQFEIPGTKVLGVPGDEAMAELERVIENLGRSADDLPPKLTSAVTLSSLDPYKDSERWGSGWSHDLGKLIGAGKALNETEILFTGEAQVASDLFSIALQADMTKRTDVFSNLRLIVWDGRLGDKTTDVADDDETEAPLRFLDDLSGATRSLTNLHQQPVELYIQASGEDWSEYIFSPGTRYITWQGSLSGIPRFDLSRMKATQNIILDVTDYCQEDLDQPSDTFRSKVSLLCQLLRRADKGSKVSVYLTADDTSDTAANDRLQGWKESLERVAVCVDTGTSAESSPVDLQLHVGVQHELGFRYTIQWGPDRSAA